MHIIGASIYFSTPAIAQWFSNTWLATIARE
jgi:hypothetical protein